MGSWVHDVLLARFPEQLYPTRPLTEPVLTPKKSRIALVTGLLDWGVVSVATHHCPNRNIMKHEERT